VTRASYSLLARCSDWFHGWRDGRAGVPDPRRAIATTPHREVLIRRALDAFEHERLRLEAGKAVAATMRARASSRHEEAQIALTFAERQLATIEPDLAAAELDHRRYAEAQLNPTMVRLRRSREHARSRIQFATAVEEARRRLAATAGELAAERDADDRRLLVTQTRVRRVYEHTHRRLAAYQRQLLRSHPDGAWVSELMDGRQPRVPDWARLPADPPDADNLPSSDPAANRTAAPAPEPAPRRMIQIGETTRFGSRPEHVDVLIPNSYGVAAVHAILRRTADGYRLSDSGHGKGTFQDGKSLRRTALHADDTFTIGDYHYRLVADDLLEETRLGPWDLVVADLDAVTDLGKARLTHMSFSQRSNTVLAVLGPSGSGKSSLLAALLGELPTASGSLYFRAMNLRTHSAQVRTELGFVPQDDSLYTTLTVEQLLTFSDRLRGPRDSKAGRSLRVIDVCTRLGIANELHALVSRLSGGQRKRVSIALEVLTGRRLLLLDEPTSGLDPATDRDVMALLRTLARDDRTVMVITHSTDHLTLTDQVLVVSTGGQPVYSGPPSDVLADLTASNYAELMGRLAHEPTAAKDALTYRNSPAASLARQQAQALRQQAQHGPQSEPTQRRPHDRFGRQLAVLVHRQIALALTRAPVRHAPNRWKKTQAAAVVAMPILVAAVGAWLAGLVSGTDGLGPSHLTTASSGAAVSLLITLCMLSGQALTYSDITAEYTPIKREHRTGTITAAVVLSKWLVFACIAAVQALVITVVFVVIRPAPVHAAALGPVPDLFIDLAATSIAAMSAGLLISVLARRLEQAVALATAAAIAQVALSGGMSDLASKPWPLQAAAWLLPARWGFAATASSVDLRAISPATPPDALWDHSHGQWINDLAILGALSLLFTATATILLTARLSRPQS